MREGPRHRSATAVLVPALLTALLAVRPGGTLPPAAADADAPPEVSVGPPADDAPSAADLDLPEDPVDVGVVAAPLAFSVGAGVGLELEDGRRYLDRLVLREPGSSQVLVNDLTTDDYVAGVAEMPGRWHLEALKAQAVAARTYGWYQTELETFLARGYDTCDTVDCQAFVGAAQEEGDFGDRWRRAVEETAGEVLLEEDGTPILARYFSTSGGRTLPNEVVFPQAGPRPYLVGTEDPADAASPFHTWEVTFTRDEFDAILERGQTLAAAAPVAEVERLGDLWDPQADVRVTGTDGTQVEVGAVALRAFVSDVAPSLFPDRFPSSRADGLHPLPTTLPSSRYTVEVTEDEVTVSGRGWGHAVGMGQYGARGRAEAGEPYDDILAAYYAGTRPTTTDDLPERIRVGLSRSSVGSVTPDVPMTIAADGEIVVEGAAGTWQVAAEAGGVRLTAPPGWGQPAAISRTEPAVGVPSLPRSVAVEATAAVPGAIALEVTDAGGEVVAEEPLGAAGVGRQVGVWDLTDGDGEPVAAGDYAVTLTVTAADGSRDGTPLPVSVPAAAVPEPADDASGEEDEARPVLIAVAVAGLLGVVVARRWIAPSDPRRSR